MRRKTGLRRAKPAKVIQADIWREGLGPCVMKHRNGFACNGRVDGHHIIYASTLRRHNLSEYLMDKRNRLALCRFHHEQHHSRFSPVPAELLPEDFWEFVADTGLLWWVDRAYPSETRDAVESRDQGQSGADHNNPDGGE